MRINLDIKYHTYEHSCLCFNHAVLEVVKGKKVKVEVDNFIDDYMGDSTCSICFSEEVDNYIYDRDAFLEISKEIAEHILKKSMPTEGSDMFL